MTPAPLDKNCIATLLLLLLLISVHRLSSSCSLAVRLFPLYLQRRPRASPLSRYCLCSMLPATPHWARRRRPSGLAVLLAPRWAERLFSSTRTNNVRPLTLLVEDDVFWFWFINSHSVFIRPQRLQKWGYSQERYFPFFFFHPPPPFCLLPPDQGFVPSDKETEETKATFFSIRYNVVSYVFKGEQWRRRYLSKHERHLKLWWIHCVDAELLSPLMPKNCSISVENIVIVTTAEQQRVKLFIHETGKHTRDLLR